MATGTPTPSGSLPACGHPACAVPLSDGPSDGAPPAIGRRAALAGIGVAALGVTAVACSGGDGGAQSSDAPEGAPGTVLGPVSDVPVGGGAVFAAQQVVVTQPSAGRFQGLSSVCPHAGCSVNEVRDGQVVCPCHGSLFGLDGAVLEGPASSPLARRAVAVQGQNVTLA